MRAKKRTAGFSVVRGSIKKRTAGFSVVRGSAKKRTAGFSVVRGSIILLLLWLAPVPVPAFQDTHPVTGRKYAGVMSADGADWLVRPEREKEENPEGALDAIGLKPGMNVADVGAGVGYMSLRMARRITPGGKVWANDLQPRMLEMLRANAAKASATNIETVLGTETDPKLPRNTMDLVILVDVYHEFSHPREMVRGIRESLKPDGRLVLLEYRKEDPNVPIRIEHKMTVDEVKAELAADGFQMKDVIETLPRQHILILTKAAAAVAPANAAAAGAR